MSEIRVDNILSADGNAAPTYSQGVNVAAGKTFTNSGDFTTAGISSFSGPVTFGTGAEITGVTTFKSDLNNIRISGVTTFADGALISGLTTFTSGVSGLSVVGPTTFTQGAVATGVVTFTGVSITAGTVAHTGGITVGGASTFSNSGEFTGNLTVGGNISCAGTITYEDVSSVDSLGIVTARQDLKVLRNASVAGVTTLTGATEIAGNLTLGGNIVGDTATNIEGINFLTASVGIFSGTSHVDLPAGTSAQRPNSPNSGYIRFNTTTNGFEGYNGSQWGGLGGGNPWVSKTANYTAAAGDRIMVNTSSSAITITLPASPLAGDTIRFLDLEGTFDTNALTIARNGKEIMHSSSDMVVNTKNAGFALVYMTGGSPDGWKIIDNF